MKLKLVRAAEEYRPQITEMLEEWFAVEEEITPWAIQRLDYHNFDDYCRNLDITDTSSGLVPDSTYFCLDEERNRMVGAVNIRHYLNDALLRNGGHIGDGVRPSERRKGIATEMIGLALQKCRELGIDKVLMVCDKENIGSAKSIIRNGGILENEIIENGVTEQRYWITLEAQEF
ncbi:MAG: GNAT family N-acetyltransferase [Lachnospiraceae bacterium]|nr:GNAT family N-acetyltransferase [Lachnospiraceae bacterium]